VRRAGHAVARALRSVLAVFFGALALLERWARRAGGAARRLIRAAVARLDSWLTPARAAFAVVVAAAACLVLSQFGDYRGVEVGQPAYADVAAIAAPPQRAKETPVDAHSYALVAVAAAAAGIALVALLRRRRRLSLLVVLAGIAALAVILLVDMPQGLDEGDAALQYEGAHATLNDGFYAEVAAAGGLILGGLALALHLRPARGPARKRARAGRRRSRSPKRPRLAGSGS